MLSIIGLTLVIRAALIPLFVKQIKSSRNMQLIQPKVKELQKKYGHDREQLAQETMKLYKETGTNPFASCLPILLQMPIFFALFRLLDQAAKSQQGHGFLTDELAEQLRRGQDLRRHADHGRPSSAPTATVAVQVLAAVLVVAMTATTFLTQRQLMSKNMPADALSGPYAQQQKMLLYVLPLVFAVGGIAFPIGVLFYWTTSNLWTMGQQFYVIRNNPAPGHPGVHGQAGARPREGAPGTASRRATEVVEGERGAAEQRAAPGRSGSSRKRQTAPAAQEVRRRAAHRARPATEATSSSPERDRRPQNTVPAGSEREPTERPGAPRDQAPDRRRRLRRRRARVTATPGARPDRRSSSTRATSPPTTSRSSSTSPTSTATSTWTSRVTAPRSRSSAPT